MANSPTRCPESKRTVHFRPDRGVRVSAAPLNAHRVEAPLADVLQQRRGLVVFKTDEGPPVSCSILSWAIDLVKDEFEVFHLNEIVTNARVCGASRCPERDSRLRDDANTELTL
jgi:hypothetical protein